MLETSVYSRVKTPIGYSPANWEDDVRDVVIESCDRTEDPSGFRVVFFKTGSYGNDNTTTSYHVGASHLKARLKKLREAGFDAPMTQKALSLMNQKRYVTLP